MPNNCLYFDFWFFKDSKLSVSSFTRYCKFQNVLCVLQIDSIRTFKQHFWHTFKKHRNSWISSSKRINCKSVSWSLQVTLNANQSGSGLTFRASTFPVPNLFVFFFFGGGGPDGGIDFLPFWPKLSGNSKLNRYRRKHRLAIFELERTWHRPTIS